MPFAGTGRDLEQAYRPAVIRVQGRTIALFAVTQVWNQPPFATHEGKDFVAWADADKLKAGIEKARRENDFVIVSYHGGEEYIDAPIDRTRHFAKRHDGARRRRGDRSSPSRVTGRRLGRGAPDLVQPRQFRVCRARRKALDEAELFRAAHAAKGRASSAFGVSVRDCRPSAAHLGPRARSVGDRADSAASRRHVDQRRRLERQRADELGCLRVTEKPRH